MAEHDPYSRVAYRKLIAWPDRIRREWPLLEGVLASGPSRRVLELGCGPGQHARALADAGFEVVGVDRSEAMIESAREEPPPEGVRFIQGDMVEVDRLVEGLFGSALCLGNTLPHVSEEDRLRRFARGLAQVLQPGAPVLLQILNYDRIHGENVRALPVNVRADPEGLENGSVGGEVVFLRLMTPLPDGRVRFFPTTLTLRPGAEQPVAVERSREILLRGWRRSELEEILGDAGIHAEQAYGGFDESPFDAATSHDLVLVARRGG